MSDIEKAKKLESIERIHAELKKLYEFYPDRLLNSYISNAMVRCLKINKELHNV